MTQRIPEPESDFENEGLPDMGYTLGSKEITGDAQEGMAVPRDHATAVDDYGTTAYEEEHGEALDGRLAREEPDVLSEESVARNPTGDSDLDTPYEGDGLAGRLVQDDEGAHGTVTAEEVGRSAGTDLGGQSAEESAVHLDPDS